MRDDSGLELHVSAAKGFHLQDDCFVAVKLGDVLKQGRYRPDRPYRFPADSSPGPHKPRIGRIDLFKQIGSCRIEASAGEHEVWVESTDPRDRGQMMNLKLRVAVGKIGAHPNSLQPAHAHAAKKEAESNQDGKVYLKDSNMEELLSNVVKAVLRERPQNPRQFMIDHLVKIGDVSLPSSISPALLEPMQRPQLVPPQAQFQQRSARTQQWMNQQLPPIEKSDSSTARPQHMQCSTLKDGTEPSLKASPRISQETKACKQSSMMERDKRYPQGKKESAELEDEVALHEKVVQEEKDLKDTAIRLLEGGVKDGSLLTALKDAHGEPFPKKDGKQENLSAHEIENKEATRRLLSGAMQDGSLLEALDSLETLKEAQREFVVKEDASCPLEFQNIDPNQVRDHLQGLFIDAMEGGQLDDIIEDIKKKEREEQWGRTETKRDLEIVLSKTRASLAGAAHSGKLRTAMSSLSSYLAIWKLCEGVAAGVGEE